MEKLQELIIHWQPLINLQFIIRVSFLLGRSLKYPLILIVCNFAFILFNLPLFVMDGLLPDEVEVRDLLRSFSFYL